MVVQLESIQLCSENVQDIVFGFWLTWFFLVEFDQQKKITNEKCR